MRQEQVLYSQKIKKVSVMVEGKSNQLYTQGM